MKLTPKQENFCKAYIETGNASEAYRRSYSYKNQKPETINRNAFALLENTKIATRVDKLRSALNKRHEVTVDSLTIELDKLLKAAAEAGQNGAGIQAVMGMAKLHGLGVDNLNMNSKQEIRTVINASPEMESLEWTEKFGQSGDHKQAPKQH